MKFLATQSRDTNDAPFKNAYKKGKDEFDSIVWEIEINTLKDLLSLAEEYGAIIVRSGGNGCQELENYNAYRE